MKTGHTPSRTETSYWGEDCEIPWFTLADVWQLRDGSRMYLGETKERISLLGLRSSAAELLPAGTVVFSRTASVGYSGIMRVPMATTQDFWNWVPRSSLLPEYLLFVFRAMKQEFDKLTMGSTHKTIYQPDAARIQIAVPPIEEQRRIVGFIGEWSARLDALIQKKQTLIERLKEKRSALISRTVTRGLPPDAARAAGLDPHPKLKPSGIDWLGDVPEHWSLPALATRYFLDLGKMLNENRITGAHLVQYLRNIDVQWDEIVLGDLKEMDIARNEIVRYTVRLNDLLVCEGGEVGRAAIVGADAAGLGYQKALHRLRPRNEGENPRFMFYTLRAATTLGVFDAGSNPNTIPHLTGEQFRRYRFPQPPPKEQVAIAQYLDRETRRIDLISERIQLAINRLQEYRTALITAAVTGKIDVRNAIPNIEAEANELADQ